MNRIKQAVQFAKEHPWEIGCVVLVGITTLATINSKHLVKVANHQSDELDKANRYFDNIVEAVRNGWEMVVNEENNMIDINLPDVVSLEA